MSLRGRPVEAGLVVARMMAMLNRSLPALVVALFALPFSSAAQPLACPAASTLVQIAPCPSLDQLRAGFLGYCGDNARMLDGDRVTCASFENYLRLKNTARWESADGRFEGYLSCQPGTAAVTTLGPAAMTIARRGNITRVVCNYGDDAALTHRTRARCTVADPAACAADPAACRANCQ